MLLSNCESYTLNLTKSPYTQNRTFKLQMRLDWCKDEL
jgi:hypothetical protein